MSTGFLTESDGTPSSMRLISVMLVLASIIVGAWIVYAQIQSENSMMVFMSLLGAGITGKLGQKMMEIKA